MAKNRRSGRPPRLSEPAPNVRRVVRRTTDSKVNTGPRPKADPIKSMAIGAGIIVLLVVFFLAPIGGKTPFNHLISAFGGGTPAAPASAPASAAPGTQS
ncbi:MAG: hypothetical protein H6706_08325 [Myxococcales bacterium]|nr:hypothetical protein [Myxococcales bacterium]